MGPTESFHRVYMRFVYTERGSGLVSSTLYFVSRGWMLGVLNGPVQLALQL